MRKEFRQLDKWIKLLYYHENLRTVARGVIKHGGKVIAYDYLGRTAEQNYKHAVNFSDEILKKFNIDVVSKGDIPKGDLILVVNHTSMVDIPAIVKLYGRKIFAAKKELFPIPILGRGMRALDMMEIDRSDRELAYETLEREINRTLTQYHEMPNHYVFFAEGTRLSKSYDLGGFGLGAFKSAQKHNLDILPVVMKGGIEILPKESLYPKSGIVYIQVLPVIEQEPYGKTIEGAKDMRHDTKTKMQCSLDELV